MRFSFILIVSLIFFYGCGTTTAQNNDTKVNTELTTGYLIDSNVSGVEYMGMECDDNTDFSGITGFDNNKSGKFTFHYDCKYISFKIGEITLGDIEIDDINKKDNIVFITDLAGKDRNDTNNINVTNIIRVLQTLDDDEDPFNGIFITEETRDKIKYRLNHPLEDDLTSEDDLQSIFTNNVLNRTLISSIKSLVHFEDTLREYNISVDTVPPYKPYLDEVVRATSNSKTFIEVYGEKNSKICVNNSCDSNVTISLYENLFLDENGYKEIALDTNMTVSNALSDFNITLVDDQNQTSEALSISIFKDALKPEVTSNSITNRVLTKTISLGELSIDDLNISDNSLDYNLTLNYEITGVDKDKIKISNPQPSLVTLSFKEAQPTGSYNFLLHIEDEAKHHEDINCTVTVQ